MHAPPPADTRLVIYGSMCMLQLKAASASIDWITMRSAMHLRHLPCPSRVWRPILGAVDAPMFMLRIEALAPPRARQDEQMVDVLAGCPQNAPGSDQPRSERNPPGARNAGSGVFRRVAFVLFWPKCFPFPCLASGFSMEIPGVASRRSLTSPEDGDESVDPNRFNVTPSSVM